MSIISGLPIKQKNRRKVLRRELYAEGFHCKGLRTCPLAYFEAQRPKGVWGIRPPMSLRLSNCESRAFVAGVELLPANIPPVVSTKSPANNNLLYISETTLRGGFFVLYQVVRIDLPRFPELLIGNKWEPIAHLTEQGFLSKFSPNL